MTDVKTLLIVDDSQTSRQILRSRFGKLRKGWLIYDSDNGLDAINMIELIKPDFVTMDVNMPNMSGLEAADKIAMLNPAIRIAVVTANIQESVHQHVLDRGYCFIEKPICELSIPNALAFFEG